MHSGRPRKVVAASAEWVTMNFGGFMEYGFINAFATGRFGNMLLTLEKNWVGAHAFMGAMSVETFRALLYLRDIDNVLLSRKTLENIAIAISLDLFAAETVKAIYTAINNAAGRSFEEIHPAELATVNVIGTSLVRSAYLEAGKFLQRHGLFGKPDSLADELIGNRTYGSSDETGFAPPVKAHTHKSHHHHQNRTETEASETELTDSMKARKNHL
jgi:hypothetical protein